MSKKKKKAEVILLPEGLHEKLKLFFGQHTELRNSAMRGILNLGKDDHVEAGRIIRVCEKLGLLKVSRRTKQATFYVKGPKL